MQTVVDADGPILERILETTCALSDTGLSAQAFGRYDAAQSKTTWARGHRRRFALVEGAELLASATRYDLAGVLDQRPVRICGIGGVVTDPDHRSGGHASALVERLLDDAAADGMELALLRSNVELVGTEQDRFETIPIAGVELCVVQPARYAAPMMLVRGGEARDVAAIVAMGRVRAAPFRFHLDRSADFVQYAITAKRLSAGLRPDGTRQLHFYIAEEGVTAAAYVVISGVGRTWTIEECGDRDPTGARVGAILQALIAREPGERRPTIRGWLPPAFVPPQVTIVPAPADAAEVLMARALGTTAVPLRLSGNDVLFWRADLF